VLKRIDHIGVVVRDMDKVRSFVEDNLGLEFRREVRIPAGQVHGVFLGLGETMIELIEIGDEGTRERRMAGEPLAHIEHIAIQVDDLEATIGRLRSRGVTTSLPEALEVGPNLHYWTNPETSGGIQYQLFAPKPR
jgi:catechol 2,3-dioxygenase-like lactoylglutathione lyase family enzyme